jgi:hypothetical protein
MMVSMLCYQDGQVTDNPHQRAFDYRLRLESIGCKNPYGNEVLIGPGQSFSLFSSVIATGLTGSSIVNMDPQSPPESIYRLSVSSGTTNNFRTGRTVSDLAGCTVTVNNNAVAVFQFTGANYTNNNQNFSANAAIVAGTTLIATGTGAPAFNAYQMTTAPANATAGAVYQDALNTNQRYTVEQTVSGGTTLIASGPTPPESTFAITCSPASASAGAVYQLNGHHYHVTTTITGGALLTATGYTQPPASGVLTYVSGTGDPTITYSSFTLSGSLTLFSGTGDGTITYSGYVPVGLLTLDSGVGDSLIIYTSVTAVGNQYTFTVNPANASVPNISTVQVGDIMRINGQMGYDTPPYAFNPINSGSWIIIAVSGTTVQAVRPAGTAFQAVQETPPGPTVNDVMFYANDKVMPGMMFQITGTFSPVTQRTYTVLDSTPNFIQFCSTQPIPKEDGLTFVPGTATFYTGVKKMVYVEVDQPCAAQFNGQVDVLNMITPIKPGSRNLRGFLTKMGETYSCTVVNTSVNQAHVKFFTVE